MTSAEAREPDPLEELELLIEDERRLSALRRRLHDQIDLGFAREAVIVAEQRVSAERRLLHARIDELRAELARGTLEQGASLEDQRRLLRALGDAD